VSSTQPNPAAQSLPQMQLGKKFWIWAFVIVLVIALLQVKSLSEWWNLIFFEPMLNCLLFLYQFLGRNFAVSIVIFTVIVKIITLPVTLKQIQTTKLTQELQPKIEELKKKYGNDKERLNQETIKLYQGAGISTTGCLWPMLIQFPIWIGMYQSIIHILANNPLQMFGLGKHIYPFFPQLSLLVPFQSRFLWVDLATLDPYYILPILVVVTMWAQQKMTAMPTTDAQQQQMNQSMQLMMPLMFGLFLYAAPAGVSLYFVVSNILGMIQQYFTTGWGDLFPQKAREQKGAISHRAPQVSAAKGRTDGSKKRKKKR